MAYLVPEPVETYARAHSSAVPDLMEQLREFTYQNVDMPQMQVGSLEGNFLKILARVSGAKRVLEVGTFTGYSTLMLASGLPEDGQVITCDIDPKTAAIAKSFFDCSPHGHKITQKLGPALESIDQLSGPFDLAFIDADKTNYTNYFKAIRTLMRHGGLIVVDNVLWSAKVLQAPAEQEESTAAICAFNTYVQGLVDLDKVMLTVRDGMFLIVV